jgi:hypothetical protein
VIVAGKVPVMAKLVGAPVAVKSKSQGSVIRHVC